MATRLYTDGLLLSFSILPQILMHQAIDTVANIRRSASNVKIQGVLEVVPATFSSRKRPMWTILRNPATDTLAIMSLARGF